MVPISESIKNIIILCRKLLFILADDRLKQEFSPDVGNPICQLYRYTAISYNNNNMHIITSSYLKCMY